MNTVMRPLANLSHVGAGANAADISHTAPDHKAQATTLIKPCT